MQISEIEAFEEILDTAATVFGKKLTEPVRRAYFEALKSLPLSVIRQRAQAHLTSAKYFPKPVDLTPPSQVQTQDQGDSKFPPLYSPEWWEGRVRVLRQTAPKGLSQASRDSLDLATFDKDDSPALRAQAREAYVKAWPWMNLDGAPQSDTWFDEQVP